VGYLTFLPTLGSQFFEILKSKNHFVVVLLGEGKKFGMKEPSVSVISKTQRAFCFHETETSKEPWVSGWFFLYSSFLSQFYIRPSSLFS
jgi:hypothetical protein